MMFFGGSKEKRKIEKLGKQLKDPMSHVKATGLSELKDLCREYDEYAREAVTLLPDILRALNDSSKIVNEQAVFCLKFIALKNPPVVDKVLPALRTASASSNRSVQREALQALKELGAAP
jgi:HEAT repeat protein